MYKQNMNRESSIMPSLNDEDTRVFTRVMNQIIPKLNFNLNQQKMRIVEDKDIQI
jgi:hypothetical protein